MGIGVPMIDLGRTIRMLEVKREELVSQLQAIDKAIAALHGTDAVVSASREQSNVVETPPVIVIKVIKPKRALSESHKQALIDGRRRAHQARQAATSRIESDSGESLPVLAKATDMTPRLVKRELAVEPLEKFLETHLN
jgi:hypothetical protein